MILFQFTSIILAIAEAGVFISLVLFFVVFLAHH